MRMRVCMCVICLSVCLYICMYVFMYMCVVYECQSNRHSYKMLHQRTVKFNGVYFTGWYHVVSVAIFIFVKLGGKVGLICKL